MLEDMSMDEWRKKYFKVLLPNEYSIKVGEDVLKHWDAAIKSSELKDILKKSEDFERLFFRDIVRMVEQFRTIPQNSIRADYIGAAINDYNFYAFSASDGYLVLGDQYFVRLLFFLSTILILHVEGDFDNLELIKAKRFFRDYVFADYVNQGKVNLQSHPFAAELLMKNKESVSKGNYLYYNLFAFILCHEIGHHMLGHTKDRFLKKFGLNDVNVAIDIRSQQDELEADIYAFDLFADVVQTVDERYLYAFFQSYFPYTPAILFNFLDQLDKWELIGQREKRYNSHPPPLVRLATLRKEFDMQEDNPYYLKMLDSLKYLMDA